MRLFPSEHNINLGTKAMYVFFFFHFAVGVNFVGGISWNYF
jgi:hypothetical protein